MIPVYTWRCSAAAKLVPKTGHNFFANLETVFLRRGHRGFMFRVRLRAGLAVETPPIQRPQGEISAISEPATTTSALPDAAHTCMRVRPRTCMCRNTHTHKSAHTHIHAPTHAHMDIASPSDPNPHTPAVCAFLQRAGWLEGRSGGLLCLLLCRRVR